MKKSVLRVCLLITGVLYILCITSVIAAASDTIFSVEMPESVGVGRSFDIVIRYNGNNPLSALQMKVKYDTDYFSFKKVSGNGDCEETYKDNNGTLSFICLFNKCASKEELVTLTFTAKTGNSSADKSFSFECVQAVDKNLDDVKPDVTPSAQISVIRKSDSSEQKSPSTRNSSKTTSSKTASSSSVSDKSDFTENFSTYSNNNVENPEEVSEHSDINTSSSQTGTGFTRLYDTDNKTALVLAGAGGTLAVTGIIFGLYKLGNMNIKNSGNDNITDEKAEDS